MKEGIALPNARQEREHTKAETVRKTHLLCFLTGIQGETDNAGSTSPDLKNTCMETTKAQLRKAA